MRKLISLYSGAGGLDLGMEAAGFEVAAAIEFNKWACNTLRSNRSWNVIEGDIHDISSQQIANVGGIAPGEVDLLIGGPPCQPFSKSAMWATGNTKRLDDPRSDTLTAYLRVLKDLKPKAFLIENVNGIAFKGKEEGLNLLKSVITQINNEEGTNYSFSWKVINCADFGVPQTRERVFIIGHRDGAVLNFPPPTHINPEEMADDLFGDNREPWVTAWEAIHNVKSENTDQLRATGKWANLLPSIPEGKNYLYHTDRGEGLPLFGWRTRYWGFLLKLAKNRPSWTLQAQPGSAIGPFHWENRKLSMEELCRLQTFPEGYFVTGGQTEMRRQLGNAVPSLIAEILGKQILAQFFGMQIPQEHKLAIQRPNTIPEPETLAPVSDEYLHLMGEHEAHPGTGKGPGARKRQTEKA
ncbi:DNA cytosine methyltransferase [Salinivibrio kushneri]|uniref:DNA cytosine methyltransferase n=1 Tax=Salinivibrio kushneri TaxID=1908198 RepID=UPI00098868E2|nr:DNA (cytosine-5-)-methyltransferase [Salinivibrio kushneri]OOE56250.1 DNA (cytosine-5-)-methyltransferase [Salinivibrio kushneri]